MGASTLVTDIAIEVPANTVLITRTDAGGRIVYVNQAFVEVSGFTRDELIGSPHNIVRHPSMPRAVFADLWETIQSGHAWEGAIKNRTKNGSYYWALVNISPQMENGKITGYVSVRSKPTPLQIRYAEDIYASISRPGPHFHILRGGDAVAVPTFRRMIQSLSPLWQVFGRVQFT